MLINALGPVAGVCESAVHFSYPLSLAPPEDGEDYAQKQDLLARAGWLQSHHLHADMTHVSSVTLPLSAFGRYHRKPIPRRDAHACHLCLAMVEAPGLPELAIPSLYISLS